MPERRTASCGIVGCRWHLIAQDNEVWRHLMNKQFVLIIERNYQWEELADYWALIANA
jgi:hypothetical protein